MAEIRENKIAEILSAKRMTQKDLAISTGITESAISYYVKGDRVPRGVNLVKIAKALEVTTDYLLGHDDSGNPDDPFEDAKRLIARNASKMTMEERLELVRILSDNR